MSFAARYFERYAYLKNGIVESKPDYGTSIIVTVPAYREDKLLYTLESIRKCILPPVVTEILILINYPASEEALADYHNHQYKQLCEWAKKFSTFSLRFYPLLYALPSSDAGVGLARKILMDEAVRRFEKINKPDGIIVSFDADSTCEQNYLLEIFNFFNHQPHINTCSIYFEHPLDGDEYSPDIYEAIAIYELYLRYYVEGLRYAGFPFAFHTIGSAFAVRASAYVKQGGMNRRKAGEDFYFLNKMMLLGGYGELNSTAVYPAPRLSNRVPFGTGAAITKITSGSDEYLYTWNPQVFFILKDFFIALPALYTADRPITYHALLKSFLEQYHWSDVVGQARKNARNEQSFVKRLFHWFDGLKVLQFIRFAHQHGLDRIHIREASLEFLVNTSNHVYHLNLKEILQYYREKQRHTKFCIN